MGSKSLWSRIYLISLKWSTLEACLNTRPWWSRNLLLFTFNISSRQTWIPEINKSSYFVSILKLFLRIRVCIFLENNKGRAVESRGGGLALPVFGQTVNPISTRGADYGRHSTTSPPPPGFQILRRPERGLWGMS